MYYGYTKSTLEIHRSDYEEIYHEFKNDFSGETLQDAHNSQDIMINSIIERTNSIIMDEYGLIERSFNGEDIAFPIRATVYSEAYMLCMNCLFHICVSMSKHIIEFFEDEEQEPKLEVSLFNKILNQGGIPIIMDIVCLDGVGDALDFENEETIH